MAIFRMSYYYFFLFLILILSEQLGSMLLLYSAMEFEVDIRECQPSAFKANEVSPRYVLGLSLTEPFCHARRLINLVDNDRPPPAIL